MVWVPEVGAGYSFVSVLYGCVNKVQRIISSCCSRSGSSSKQRPRSFSIAAGASWCLYALPISRRLWRSYMCFGVISLWVSGKFTLFGDEQTTLKDIKAPSLGPGAAAASERAAILDHPAAILDHPESWNLWQLIADLYILASLNKVWGTFEKPLKLQKRYSTYWSLLFVQIGSVFNYFLQ